MPPFSKQCLLETSNFYLTFYKTKQLATWLKVSPKCQVQIGFQAYSSKKKKFILSIKTPVIPSPATTNWVCYNKMADQGIEILIIQGSDLGLGTQEYFQFSLFSKLKQSYAPFWQEVITVIVALFPKLKLSRTLWGDNSGVQICCTVKYRLYSASLTFPEFQRGRFKQLPIRKGKKIQKQRGNNQMVVQPWDGSWFLLKENMHNNVFWVHLQNWSPHPGGRW